MAGLFQVLWGAKGGGFRPPEALKGTNGKALIIPTSGQKKMQELTRKICTRPFAVDWDGDGDLDLVTGNFSGSFYLFRGEGKGRFRPVPEILKAGKEELQLPKDHHSDPFVVDWDGDGDLDLLSGSASGTIRWAENEAGPGKEPRLKPFQTLISAPERDNLAISFERVLPTAPSRDVRIWVDDIDGDGKLDILAGDQAMLLYAAKGLSREEFTRKYTPWRKKAEMLYEKWQANKNDRQAAQRWSKHFYSGRNTFMQEENTGFVWLFRQK